MYDLNQSVLEFKRKFLADMFLKLTEKQKKLFNKIFGNKVSDEKLDSAIALCGRTLNN